MRNLLNKPVQILLFVFVVIGTTICNAEPSPKMSFMGFVVNTFEPLQTPDGEEDINLPSPREIDLLKTVFSRVCKNCWVYSTVENAGNGADPQAGLDVPTYAFVKETMKNKARFSKRIDTMINLISTHAFVDWNGELRFLFRDSKIVLNENGDVVSCKNTMSAAELADIILEFQCERMILILDCCFSGNTGALTRLADRIDVDKERGPKSLAILSSSGGNQTSQVFVNREISLYTGYLLAAISGMGDLNRDGKISVQEIHTYAYSLVGMVSKIQEREMLLVDKISGSKASTDQSVQRPELKTIVKGANADIAFDVPGLPFHVTMEFLVQNIRDLIQLHNLDPKKIRVDDFVEKNPSRDGQRTRLLGRVIAKKVQTSLDPNCQFSKSITDTPQKRRSVDFQYAIQGEYIPVLDEKTGEVSLSVNCRIINLASNEALEMFAVIAPPELQNDESRNDSQNSVPDDSVSTVITDMAEIAPYILPGSKSQKCARVTLEHWSDGGSVPFPAYPGGNVNDYAVRKGDSLVVKIQNLTDEPIAALCLVDGLNSLILEGEKDADRVSSISSHIEKIKYFIIPPKEIGYFIGWTTIRRKDGKSEFLFNNFVVQDAPNSLRSSLKLNPSQVDAPLGDIRVLIYQTQEINDITRGAAPAEVPAGMGVGEKVYKTEARRSKFRIPSSTAEPEEIVVLHYAFESQK